MKLRSGRDTDQYDIPDTMKEINYEDIKKCLIIISVCAILFLLF
jgi:hypothetical protein